MLIGQSGETEGIQVTLCDPLTLTKSQSGPLIFPVLTVPDSTLVLWPAGHGTGLAFYRVGQSARTIGREQAQAGRYTWSGIPGSV